MTSLSPSSIICIGEPCMLILDSSVSSPNSGTPIMTRRFPFNMYMWYPSVLRKSASSTPFSWLLVPENCPSRPESLSVDAPKLDTDSADVASVAPSIIATSSSAKTNPLRHKGLAQCQYDCWSRETSISLYIESLRSSRRGSHWP